MVDRNLQNFHGRIGRIERIHNAGGGFEAEGALGMSFYKARRRTSRRFGLLGPLALIMITVVGIKATVHASLGAELYEERIVALRAGTAADQVGAYVLQADPITVAIAERIRTLLY